MYAAGAVHNTKQSNHLLNSCCLLVMVIVPSGADDEEVGEVKSKPAKSVAKPTKKPVLPDSVKAIAKASLLQPN